MTFLSEVWHQMIFGLATRTGVCLEKSLRQFGPEKGIVLDVDPQHGRPGRLTELARGVDQFVGRAIVVGLSIDAPAATCRKRHYGRDRLVVLARQGDCAPSAARFTDDDNAFRGAELLLDEIVD